MAPKVTKKWVPKQVQQEVQQPISAAPAAKMATPIPAPMTTPAAVAQAVTSDDDAGWKVVSRRSRDKGKAFISVEPPMQNSYQLLTEAALV